MTRNIYHLFIFFRNLSFISKNTNTCLQKVVNVFVINGKKVPTQKVSANNTTLSAGKLSKGLNFVRVSKADGTLLSQKKFIKEQVRLY
jgi:hypothetical protein